MRSIPTVTPLVMAVGLLASACGTLDDLLSSPSELAIQRFTASPREVPAGGVTKLSWNVDGAEAVEIDNGVGVVGNKGSIEVRPTRTATYTLRARAGTSSATSAVQVSVMGTSPSPSPTASAAPSPSPSPLPTPTPTPSPSPTPPPASGSCNLPAMPECGAAEGPKGVWGCCKEEREATFEEIVEQAIEKLQRERPSLFDGDRPKDGDAYVKAVAEMLQRDFGVCAKQGGPDDEIGVKNSNGFNEQYDILLGNGRIRHYGYTVTCRPARF